MVFIDVVTGKATRDPDLREHILKFWNRPSKRGTPRISVVIICYNMAREVPRTVQSFLPPYQRGLAEGDVEVIVLENGSSRPVPPDLVAGWPGSVRYIKVDNPHPSPARALNQGIELARGDIVCPVIDGARMASPGLLAAGLRAIALKPRSLVATVSFHLGDKLQQFAVTEGYDQAVEDRLLESISWPADGYRLFEICAPGGSSKHAWFGTIAESNAPILPKALFRKLGGYDERFDTPGGGLVNLDFLRRATDDPALEYFLVLGEATFHQFHGGVTTSRHVQLKEEDGETTWSKYARQYEQIRGKPYKQPSRQPVLIGTFPDKAARIAAKGLENLLGP